MKYFSSMYALILLSIIGTYNCSKKKIEHKPDKCIINTSNKAKLDILVLISNIEHESSGFVSMKELRKSKSFLLIYDNPEVYQDEIFKYITSSKVSLTHKLWMIESQSKCDDIYYKFATNIVNLYKENVFAGSGEKILTELIMPANSPSLPFLKLEDIKFQKLLNSISTIKELSPEFLTLISDIKSGYVLKNWSLYY